MFVPLDEQQQVAKIFHLGNKSRKKGERDHCGPLDGRFFIHDLNHLRFNPLRIRRSKVRTRNTSETNCLNLKLHVRISDFYFLEFHPSKWGEGIDCPRFSELVTFSSQGITVVRLKPVKVWSPSCY